MKRNTADKKSRPKADRGSVGILFEKCNDSRYRTDGGEHCQNQPTGKGFPPHVVVIMILQICSSMWGNPQAGDRL
jgi:hypothetical protein